MSPQNSLGWIDAVTREPLPGPRWPLPGWWALAVSRDRQAVLLRHYASDPFVLATSDTRRFGRTKPFLEGVSSVKGAALAWPDRHRLMVAKDEAYGQPHGMTGIDIVDPVRGRQSPRRELSDHLAGAAGGRHGLVLALSSDANLRAPPTVALVDWAAGIRPFPLTGLEFDNAPGGQEPAAGVALSPDEHTALVGSSHGLTAIDLATGSQHRFGTPGGVIVQLEWLDARHALLVTRPGADAAVPTPISLLDPHTGTLRVVGEATSIVATGPGRFAYTPPGGGITTVTARGTRLSHHASAAPLWTLYPRSSGPYVMAQPHSASPHPGRRITIDLRNGALALDATYDHPPSDAVPLAGT